MIIVLPDVQLNRRMIRGSAHVTDDAYLPRGTHRQGQPDRPTLLKVLGALSFTFFSI
jgi:hypothetical protein